MTTEELRKLYKAGFVSYKALFYTELDSKVKQLIKSGVPKTKAVQRLAREVGVCEMTVWRACKSLTHFS
jgi:hypothetical protein